MSPFVLVVCIIGLALIFDYINGFHDAANSIATVVSTRVLTPGVAVIWAAVFNFLAAYLLGTGVAATIGSGFVNVRLMTPWVVLAGLHLVSGVADKLFSCFNRWLRRRRIRQSGSQWTDSRKMGRHTGFYRAFAIDWSCFGLSVDGGCLLVFSPVHSLPDGSPFSALSTGFGRLIQLRARDQ
jgi:hypothetical protein